LTPSEKGRKEKGKIKSAAIYLLITCRVAASTKRYAHLHRKNKQKKEEKEEEGEHERHFVFHAHLFFVRLLSL